MIYDLSYDFPTSRFMMGFLANIHFYHNSNLNKKNHFFVIIQNMIISVQNI